VNSDECLGKVNHQVAEAREKGVTGVPFTIIDGKWAVSGGQSAPVFVKVRMIRKIAIRSARLTARQIFSKLAEAPGSPLSQSNTPVPSPALL
jgi:predicted DsbA family dithiol-disulfide isomerase